MHALKHRPMPTTKITLREAVQRALLTRWRGMRTAHHMADLAARAMEDFASTARSSVDRMTLDGLKDHHVAATVSRWLAKGLSPATINKTLVCAGVCGAPVKGLFVSTRKSQKWWLTPEAKVKALAFCRATGKHDFLTLADYIEWTTATGLRVEETLRLKARHITGWDSGVLSVIVPGSKTAKAQATLPLTPEAASVIRKRITKLSAPDTRVFPIEYGWIKRLWAMTRDHTGEKGNRTATLKALRRNAARHLHVDKGMPLDMVRQYLRHSNIATTMEYLRLVGGYSEDEMRRYLVGDGALDQSTERL